MVDHVNVDVA